MAQAFLVFDPVGNVVMPKGHRDGGQACATGAGMPFGKPFTDPLRNA